MTPFSPEQSNDPDQLHGPNSLDELAVAPRHAGEAIPGKRRSEHECLYCALCFKSLTRDECSYLPNGKQQDICVPCAEGEQAMLVKIAQERCSRTCPLCDRMVNR